MHNKKIYLLVGICLVFLMAKSTDAIVINEIMYDPNGADGDREWIELYNNETNDIDITGWRFYESGTNHTLTLIQGNMIIPKNGYAVIVDNNDSFLSDYPSFNGTLIDSTFSLLQDGEFICILDSSLALVDCVNYSKSWGANDNGNTLEKIDPDKGSTKDNWNESKVNGGTPGMKNSVSSTISEQNLTAEPTTIPIYVNVIGKKPSINNITISPDYYSTEGFQIMPNAGENKEITINAVIGDDDSIDNIASVTTTINNNEIELLKKETLNEYEAIYEGKINMSFYDASGNYDITLKAVDNSSSEEIKTTQFEYLELLAIDINFDTINFGDITTGTNNTISNQDLTIHNIGNVISDIEVGGTNLTNGEEAVDISNLQYQFDTSPFVPLLNNPTIADISLGCDESSYKNMNLRLFIPEGTKTGSYSGSIIITAIAN